MTADVPVSTYRLQLGPGFTFADATNVLSQVERLGITHIYLSPILTAAPGSTHGYDVVDHGSISAVLGGRAGLERLSATAHRLGMGVVVDVVPNHMAVPVPAEHNRRLWDVLTHGRDSAYAHWFDIDYSFEGQIVLPVLGQHLAEVLAAGELVIEENPVPAEGNRRDPRVLRYYDHRFPIRPGTEELPLPELLERQAYRLAYWRSGEVNYRRFFDVDSLIAIRVEDQEVFRESHRLLLELLHEGWIDGLRIDHPDGLADPGAYLHRLDAETAGAWTVVEKILAPDEPLPQHWPVAGTTGYDAAWRIAQVFIEPTAAAPLRQVMHRFSTQEFHSVRDRAKREVITQTLVAELHRLTRLLYRICTDDVLLRDIPARQLQDALVELLVAADRYRAYSPAPWQADPPGGSLVRQWRDDAFRQIAAGGEYALDVVTDLVLGQRTGSPGRADQASRSDAPIRFQQLCGAVMAKGIEDTTYYRWTHLSSLCEVGGAPEQFAIEPEDLYQWAQYVQATWPATMTALSTHDAKRSEDVRARIGVLSEYPLEWSGQVDHLREATCSIRPDLDPSTEYLLWQTLAGTWTEAGAPESDRIAGYLLKASREAGLWTTWTERDRRGEEQLEAFIAAVLSSAAVGELMTQWRHRTAASVRAAILGARALQLTLPGVADTYQGTEVTTTALVDPDNRRPVDFDAIGTRLGRLDSGEQPWDLASEKLRLVSRLLRLRRRRRESFVGPGAGFGPLSTTSSSAVAFTRTRAGEPQVVTVATRRRRRLSDRGGWGDHELHLPKGQWSDVLTGATLAGGTVRLATMLGTDPVAVLERTQ